MKHLCAAIAVLIFSSAAAFAADAPFTPDEHTVALFHLDGNAKDAAPPPSSPKPRGQVGYAPGRFGQALKVDGTGALTVYGRRKLQVGNRSWTIECWVKPRRGQREMSAVSSVPGLGRSAGIRIYGNDIVGFFSATESSRAYVRSKPLGKRLFDGKWHHIAVVRDQERNGEVRVYVDGEHVSANQQAMGLPIITSRKSMPLTIGATAPWTVGKRSSYTGMIDEVRISDMVRPQFRAAADAPKPLPKVVRKPIPGASVSPDAPQSKAPVALTPAKTAIVTSGFLTSPEAGAAARLLQKWLRAAAKTKTGFPIRKDNKLPLRKGTLAIAVGRTGFVNEQELASLDEHTIVMRRKGNVVCVFGGSPQATLWAAVRFLDEFAGVRFYMPDDLFTSTPPNLNVTIAGVNRTITPYVKSCSTSGFHNDYHRETPWRRYNAMNRRRGGSHQHNMFTRFAPSRYAAKYPEIYPIIKGKRFIPKARKDRHWQPCFSEPRLVDVAVDSAIRYFKQYPDHLYIGFSVEDTHQFCECPRCAKGYKEIEASLVKEQPNPRRRRMFALRKIHSPIYWRFMNSLAKRLETTLPAAGIKGKKLIVGLVYSATRGEIDFKLHPDICTWFVFKWSDGLIDKRLLPDGKGGYKLGGMEAWLSRSSHIGHHDWAHGKGMLIPRINTQLTSKFFRLFKPHDLVFTHTEAYPNWGLDGPKLFIHSRIWWDPDVDVKALWKQFCDDMFGPASPTMYEYFMTLEDLWVSLNSMQERKLNRWYSQFLTRPEHRTTIARCRQRLDKAAVLAETKEQKARIEQFSKSFRLSEKLFGLAAKPSAEKAEELKAYVADVIAPDPMTAYRLGRGKAGAKYLDTQVQRCVKALTNPRRR